MLDAIDVPTSPIKPPTKLAVEEAMEVEEVMSPIVEFTESMRLFAYPITLEVRLDAAPVAVPIRLDAIPAVLETRLEMPGLDDEESNDGGFNVELMNSAAVSVPLPTNPPIMLAAEDVRELARFEVCPISD